MTRKSKLIGGTELTFESGKIAQKATGACVVTLREATVPASLPANTAAGLAVTLSGLPFDGPVAAVRVALIGGNWKVNPTYQELELATFDVVVAGRVNDRGSVDILMVEGEAPEDTWQHLGEGGVAPTEEIVAEGLEVAKASIADIIGLRREGIAETGGTGRGWSPTPA